MRFIIFFIMTYFSEIGDCKNISSIHFGPSYITERSKEKHVVQFVPRMYIPIPTPGSEEYGRTARFRRRSIQPTRTRLKDWRRIFKTVRSKYSIPKPRRRKHDSEPVKRQRQKIRRIWTRARKFNEELSKSNIPPYMRKRPNHKKGVTKKENLRNMRTAPYRDTFTEQCDYSIHYCLRAYNTGIICGRTIYVTYHTFTNYCTLDYVNCMERYEVWMIAHMGPCFNITNVTYEEHYGYTNDYFLDRHVANSIFLAG